MSSYGSLQTCHNTCHFSETNLSDPLTCRELKFVLLLLAQALSECLSALKKNYRDLKFVIVILVQTWGGGGGGGVGNYNLYFNFYVSLLLNSHKTVRSEIHCTMFTHTMLYNVHLCLKKQACNPLHWEWLSRMSGWHAAKHETSPHNNTMKSMKRLAHGNILRRQPLTQEESMRLCTVNLTGLLEFRITSTASSCVALRTSTPLTCPQQSHQGQTKFAVSTDWKEWSQTNEDDQSAEKQTLHTCFTEIIMSI